MIQYVKIPLVQKKRPFATRISVYSFMVICVFFFITITYSNSKTLTVISIFLIIISSIGMLLFRKFLIEGYVILYPENIVIKTKTLKQDISVKNLTKLKFSFGGFDGDFYTLNPKSASLKDGTDNFIMLQNKNEEYSFELFLNKSNLIPLSTIFNNWKKINSNFVIVGEWGFKIKSL